MHPTQRFFAGITQLKEQGFELVATLAFKELPEAAQRPLIEAGIGANDTTHFLLIGNGGSRFWQQVAPHLDRHADPIDHYSERCARDFARQYLPACRSTLLYPGHTIVPLQQLGQLAGWHHASPLGLGINAHWGLWYAYRALLMVDTPLPPLRSDFGPSPCASCPDHECIQHCPAGALHQAQPIDMQRCAGYRLQAQSPCADRCLARLNCPISRNHQYPLEQVRYHYRLSLETLRHYYP